MEDVDVVENRHVYFSGGSPPTSPSLFLDQTEARREYLRVWMTGPPLSQGLDPALHFVASNLSPLGNTTLPASSSGASFFAWQRRARNASDWWWTARDHGMRAHFHQKRDVWVRGSHTPSPARLRAHFLIFPSYLLLRSLVGLSASLTRDLGTRLFSHYFFCFYIYFNDFIFSSLDICFIPFTFGTTVLIGTFVNI